jgi:hypothetical protein
MTRLRYAALSTCGLLLVLTAQPALGQSQVGKPPANPLGNPAVSPYLNLRRGWDPGVNYYGVVRPQIETRETLQQLQQQNLYTQQAVQQAEASYLQPATGHAVMFQNYSHYYRFYRQGGAGVIPPLGAYGAALPAAPSGGFAPGVLIAR